MPSSATEYYDHDRYVEARISRLAAYLERGDSDLSSQERAARDWCREFLDGLPAKRLYAAAAALSDEDYWLARQHHLVPKVQSRMEADETDT